MKQLVLTLTQINLIIFITIKKAFFPIFCSDASLTLCVHMAGGGRLPDNLNEHSRCGALNIPDLRPQIHNVHTDSILGVVPAWAMAFLALSHFILGRGCL